jgi:hypothetical protein
MKSIIIFVSTTYIGKNYLQSIDQFSVRQYQLPIEDYSMKDGAIMQHFSKK